MYSYMKTTFYCFLGLAQRTVHVSSKRFLKYSAFKTSFIIYNNGTTVEALVTDTCKWAALPVDTITKPCFSQFSYKLCIFILVQLQLQTPFLCPKGVLLQKLPLYVIKLFGNFKQASASKRVYIVFQELKISVMGIMFIQAARAGVCNTAANPSVVSCYRVLQL